MNESVYLLSITGLIGCPALILAVAIRDRKGIAIVACIWLSSWLSLMAIVHHIYIVPLALWGLTIAAGLVDSRAANRAAGGISAPTITPAPAPGVDVDAWLRDRSILDEETAEWSMEVLVPTAPVPGPQCAGIWIDGRGRAGDGGYYRWLRDPQWVSPDAQIVLDAATVAAEKKAKERADRIDRMKEFWLYDKANSLGDDARRQSAADIALTARLRSEVTEEEIPDYLLGIIGQRATATYIEWLMTQ